MVDGCQVLGGHAQLDHLAVVRRLQHPVTDLRRLDDTVARLEAEGGPLVLVDQVEPAAVAVNELKGDGVEVHHVRHRASLANADVRGDHGPAEASRNQVAVLHAGAADDPRLALVQPLHHQGVTGRGPLERRAGGADLDSRSVGSGQLGLARGEPVRVLAQQANRAGWFLRAALQPDAQPVARHGRHRRIVGGKDRLQAKAQPVDVERQVRMEIPAGQPDFRLHASAAGVVRRAASVHGAPCSRSVPTTSLTPYSPCSTRGDGAEGILLGLRPRFGFKVREIRA